MTSLNDLKEPVAQEDSGKTDTDNSDKDGPDMSPDNIREVLDDVEAQIERVREAVNRLGEERDGLIELLDSIGGSVQTTSLSDMHKEETMLEVDRLKRRVGEVVCLVKTRRTQSQVESLKGVEEEMARLVSAVERDLEGLEGERMCTGFLAACGGDVMGKSQNCQKFEKLVLGCAVEDQKLIKKRLTELLAQIVEIKDNGTAKTESTENEKLEISSDSGDKITKPAETL